MKCESFFIALKEESESSLGSDLQFGKLSMGVFEVLSVARSDMLDGDEAESEDCDEIYLFSVD